MNKKKLFFLSALTLSMMVSCTVSFHGSSEKESSFVTSSEPVSEKLTTAVTTVFPDTSEISTEKENTSSASEQITEKESSSFTSEATSEITFNPTSEVTSEPSSDTPTTEPVTEEPTETHTESVTEEESTMASSEAATEPAATAEITSDPATSETSASEPSSEEKQFLSTQAYSEGFEAKLQYSSLANVHAYYKKTTDSSFTIIDDELLRLQDGIITVDYLGLPSGTYTFKVETPEDDYIKDEVAITSYDRSGYAHFGQSSGIGAYNNDGSLKTSAQVLYVSDENKNTVTLTAGSKTYTGLVAILQAQSKFGFPLDVRILGTINAATWNKLDYGKSSVTPSDVTGMNGENLSLQNYTESEIISAGFNDLSDDTAAGITKLNGLTNKIKYDSSKNEFDSYYNMADISSAQNLTIEGVGEDALLYQWGFTFKSCSYVEIRNLTFDDYTEDACSFEGSSGTYDTLDSFTSGHIWIHNNTFNEGKNNWDVCNEQDKHEGDGATDFKYNANITLSYNHYVQNHKTGLVGGSSSQMTANLTFHHNYYESCKSRLPLARQATMHMYNNYYYNSGTSLSIRAGGYAFVEGCYFENGTNPMVTVTEGGKNGAIKSYQNKFVNVSGTNAGTEVSSRTETVDNENAFSTSFDTDSSVFYYDSVNKVSKVSYLSDAATAKNDCIALSGPTKANVSEASSAESETEDDTPVTHENATLLASDFTEGTYTSSVTSGIFTLTATSSKTVSVASSSAFKDIDSSYTHEIKLGGAGASSYRSVSFSLEASAKITIAARSSSSGTARTMVIKSGSDTVTSFEGVDSAATYTASLAKGDYYITSASSGLNIASVIIEYN